MGKDDETIAAIVQGSQTIAVVGLSADETKASNGVARYLMTKGYTVIPVNPGEEEILGQKCYHSLLDIPVSIDIVDIFMRPGKLLPVVREAVRIHPKCIWLQLGIINEEAEKLAREEGVFFVQDRCIKIEHRRLSIPTP